MKDYSNILIESAATGARIQRDDGSLPEGCNNKWNDQDTPVRATSHFAIQFMFAYRYTNKDIFKSAANKALDYLLSPEARPYGLTFHCRTSKKKDQCNGVIGQAWALEALLHGYSMLGRTDCLDCAKHVFSLHPFDPRYGLFGVIEIDGRNLGVGKTLNHQLIFSAMGMFLCELGCDEFSDRLTRFYSLLSQNIYQDETGLLHHHVRKGRNRVERSLFDAVRYMQRKKLTERSSGYQSFNLFALGIAYRNYKISRVWESHELRAILEQALIYALNPIYLASVKSNPFALAFRLTGQEILFFKRIFQFAGDEENLIDLIETQLERHWNREVGLLNKNTDDPRTLSARLYEMWYLMETLDDKI